MILLTGTDKTINPCKCGRNPEIKLDDGFFSIVCVNGRCKQPKLVIGKDLNKTIDKWNEYVVKG